MWRNEIKMAQGIKALEGSRGVNWKRCFGRALKAETVQYSHGSRKLEQKGVERNYPQNKTDVYLGTSRTDQVSVKVKIIS